MAIDELQQVAHARAAMLMRGFEPLALEIGPAFHRSLGAYVSPEGILLDMDVRVHTNMEGFRVVAASGN